MQAGDLDQKILFQREQRVPDGGGGWTASWAALCFAWAKAVPLSGTERDAAEQVAAQITHRFTVRRSQALADITAADRILWQGRVFNIRRIADAGARPSFLDVDAEAGVA